MARGWGPSLVIVCAVLSVLVVLPAISEDTVEEEHAILSDVGEEEHGTIMEDMKGTAGKLAKLKAKKKALSHKKAGKKGPLSAGVLRSVASNVIRVTFQADVVAAQGWHEERLGESTRTFRDADAKLAHAKAALKEQLSEAETAVDVARAAARNLNVDRMSRDVQGLGGMGKSLGEAEEAVSTSALGSGAPQKELETMVDMGHFKVYYDPIGRERVPINVTPWRTNPSRRDLGDSDEASGCSHDLGGSLETTAQAPHCKERQVKMKKKEKKLTKAVAKAVKKDKKNPTKKPDMKEVALKKKERKSKEKLKKIAERKRKEIASKPLKKPPKMQCKFNMDKQAGDKHKEYIWDVKQNKIRRDVLWREKHTVDVEYKRKHLYFQEQQQKKQETRTKAVQERKRKNAKLEAQHKKKIELTVKRKKTEIATKKRLEAKTKEKKGKKLALKWKGIFGKLEQKKRENSMKELQFKKKLASKVNASKNKAKAGQYRPMHTKLNSKCLVAAGAKVKMGGCGGSKWMFNFFTSAVTAKNGQCLERAAGTKTLKMAKCNGKKPQKWKYFCGGVILSLGAPDKLVLTVEGSNVVLKKYYGKKKQLWNFSIKVVHGKCDNARYKVMKFDGSTATTVRLSNFLSVPTKQIAVSLWMKGMQGSPFSYASKNHVNAFAVTNPRFLQVYVMDQKINTHLNFAMGRWTHLAVSWDSNTGILKVFKDGHEKFRKTGVMKGKKITPGGCLMVGQRAQEACKKRIASEAFKGLLTDFIVNRGPMTVAHVRKLMPQPVSKAVLAGAGKLTGAKPPANMRIAYLSRQYASQELGKNFPPVCKLKVNKELSGPPGWMHWGGAGDVHYHTFGHCFYDDQSIGEWTALQVIKKWWEDYPLMVQFRTSPNAQRCSWCQNGAVAFIDGCAVSYKGEQASAGFGGFNFPNSHYKPYAALNGKPLGNSWKRGKSLRAKARLTMQKSYGAQYGNFQAILADGTQLTCAKGSIKLRVPKKLIKKVAGMAGTGHHGHEWIAGPNKKASGGVAPGKETPGLSGCKPTYQYPKPTSPFNGNSATKPVVRWFKSWQVDGVTIPSAFAYCCGRGAGSFNRIAGKKLKPISKVASGRPTGAKAKAMKACKAVRNNPKALKKCIFDFMVLGKSAVKKTVRDRMQKRRSKNKKPTVKTVRDLTKWRNEGTWGSHPSWACVKDFKAHDKSPNDCAPDAVTGVPKCSKACLAKCKPSRGPRCGNIKKHCELENKTVQFNKEQHVKKTEREHKYKARDERRAKEARRKEVFTKAKEKRKKERMLKYVSREQAAKEFDRAMERKRKFFKKRGQEKFKKIQFKRGTDTKKSHLEIVHEHTCQKFRTATELRTHDDAQLPKCGLRSLLPVKISYPKHVFGTAFTNKKKNQRWTDHWDSERAASIAGMCSVMGAETMSECDQGCKGACFGRANLRRFSCKCQEPFSQSWMKVMQPTESCSIDDLDCLKKLSSALAKSTIKYNVGEALTWLNVCKLNKVDTHENGPVKKPWKNVFSAKMSHGNCIAAKQKACTDRPLSKGKKKVMVQRLLHKQKAQLKNQGMRWLDLPKSSEPKGTCGSIFVSSDTVCNKPPFVNFHCSKRIYRGGCGCYGKLLMAQVDGALSDEGHCPHCTKKFTDQSLILKNSLSHNNVENTVCAASLYQQCKDYVRQYVTKSLAKEKDFAQRAQNAAYSKNMKFNRTMVAFEDKVIKEEKVEDKLRTLLARPGKDYAKYFNFAKIPFIEMKGAAFKSATSFATCKEYCASRPKCKSISYSKSKSICVWSPITFQYSEGFNCYLKRMRTDTISFNTIPGMMYQDPSFTVENKRAFSECKLACFEDASCQMFSWAEGNRCIMGGENLSYNEDFNYYEKEPKPKFTHPSKKKPTPKNSFNSTALKAVMLQKVDVANKAMVRLIGVAHKASTPYKNLSKKYGEPIKYLIRAVKLDFILKKKRSARKARLNALLGKKKKKLSKRKRLKKKSAKKFKKQLAKMKGKSTKGKSAKGKA